MWIEYRKIISDLPALATKEDYKEASFADWFTGITTKTRPDDWVCSPLPTSVALLSLIVLLPALLATLGGHRLWGLSADRRSNTVALTLVIS